jgi:phosphoribosylaminoimidazolecarboxamide formyltransferase/IMP cyclohydrolase
MPVDRPIRRALISVSDKTGMLDLARALADRGVTLISTGGTSREMAEAGLPVTDVSAVTGMAEMMDGRVKTLHPRIHGGILAIRDRESHVAAMLEHEIEPIDLLIVNLYPFEATLAGGADEETCIENIDIGGPAMIRAAAKNHAYVTVVVDPADYADVITAMDAGGGATDLSLRKRLAAKAFSRTAAYDAAISTWFLDRVGEATPKYRAFGGILAESLRYGENPHQMAAFYLNGEQRPGVATARQLQGKALSYNNLNDTDAALECVGEFAPSAGAAVVIVKHANPCGVATGATLLSAYRNALACDPVSAFGGIVALNQRLDVETALAIIEIFTEVIVAPDATAEAIEIVASKKNLRLLLTGALPDARAPGVIVKSLAGGLLVQSRDNAVVDDMSLKVVTRRAPSGAELEDLKFAFRVAKHVRSNAIVYAKDGATVGIGAGQMSRVDSARIAARKALDAQSSGGAGTKGSVVASDAFFPFADGLEALIEAGATAVIQPGGSVKDAEVIAAADAAGLAMVFTGIRHFRH